MTASVAPVIGEAPTLAPGHSGGVVTRGAGASTSRYYPGLDGLRGLAVLATMILHYELRSWPYRTGALFPTWLVVQHGWIGVEAFFVLSGFLITGILFDSKERPHYWRNYYARRALRIFPLYYLALVLIFVVLPKFGGAAIGAAPVAGHTQVWFWTYSQSILIALRGYGASPRLAPHFWTLSVEEQFYVLWPLAVFALDRPRLMRVIVVALGVSLGLRIALFAGTGNYLTGWMLMPARLDGLALGAFSALLVRGPAGSAPYRLPARRLAVVLLSALALMEVWRHRGSPEDVVIGTLGLTLWSGLMACVVMIGVASHSDDLALRLLSIRPLRVIGKYGYGMYVWHYMVLIALQSRGFTIAALETAYRSTWEAHATFLAVNTGATCLVAFASWHLYEKPFLGLKRYFATPRSDGENVPGASAARRQVVPGALP